MSGSVRAGLIFGLVGLILVIGIGFVPAVGPVLCGPGVALLLGGVAGYLGARWTATKAGAGQGALAGTIAGVGALIGAIISWIIIVNVYSNTPEFQSGFGQAFTDAMQRQQPGSTMTAEQAQGMIGIIGPIVGVIFGVINLVGSLVGGLIGGLIGRHEDRAVAAPVVYPPATPPLA